MDCLLYTKEYSCINSAGREAELQDTTYQAPQMYIDGRWTAGAEPGEPVLNPATGEGLAPLPMATEAEVALALESAAKGFETWRWMPAEQRCAIMVDACRLLRERADAIAPRITLEQGKPVAESKAEILRAADIVEWDANEGRRAYGNVIPGQHGMWRMALREPIGPVAAFTPWNFPISSPGRKLGGALAAGCSVILKGSSDTPYSSAALVACFVDAGVPEGVINLLFGDSARISRQLVESPVIRAITLTGSVPVGKHLAQLAAQHMKPAIMELGGHSPVIVCADADPVETARLAAAGKFRNAGQICTAPTRFVVHRDIHDAFVRELSARANAITVGDGLSSETQMGPVATTRRLEVLRELIEDATGNGGVAAAGGERIGERGNFLQPTVLTNLAPDARILREEPFGPVAPVMPFGEIEEAIGIANALEFGLCAYAFTRSQKIAYELAHRIECGILSINHFGTSQADTPFGGVKQSGYGREGGSETLNGFMITKFVSHHVQ